MAAWGAACSSSGKATTPNGPVFDTDGGADVITDHLPDAHFTFDAPRDGGTSSDARDAGVGDAKHDADATTIGTSDGAADATSSDATTGTDAPSDGSGSADVVTTLDASLCGSGTGTIAVVGGSAAVAFGAVSKNGAPFTSTSFTTSTVAAPPSLIPFGAGYLAAFSSGTSHVIESTLFTAGSTPPWSTPIAIPALAGVDASATEMGAPGLAALGTNAELVYQGTDFMFYHGVYSGGVWGPASDPVGGTGTAHDFGPSAPSSAAVGTTLYVAFDGNDHGLYVTTWTAAGGWTAAYGIGGAGTSGVPATLVALTSGAEDLMLVFAVQSTNLLYSVVHTSGGTGASSWSAPVQVDPLANSATAVSIAPLANGGAVLTYLGSTDAFPYFSIYTAGASTPWTTPALVYAESLPLASPPQVAAGVCGTDAIAALVEPSGIALVPLKSGTWGTPVLMNGTGSLTYASIATTP